MYGRHILYKKTKVYVGNLGTGVSRRELKRAFSYYGPLRTVWIVKNPPGFPFVEFEDPAHAEDAVPLAQRSFGPSDKCGKKGHHAYDCHHYSQQRGSRSRGRRYSHSCSRTSHRGSRSESKSRSLSTKRNHSPSGSP
ncbi:unnamed protein product [Nyctereutes procyonoides]|uniref:(raccoon dog) hypothetical protein n=1 Tax=Nyctereutes procyonoides TaxID=34880 RepID=A0A811Z7A7_NYCPR|nr:unnamed protein product [Nyctereutes procyonoides]